MFSTPSYFSPTGCATRLVGYLSSHIQRTLKVVSICLKWSAGQFVNGMCLATARVISSKSSGSPLINEEPLLTNGNSPCPQHVV